MSERERTLTATGSDSLLPAHQRAAIDIRNLVVTYGARRAVDGLTFTAPTGAIFGFLGPNGSGKTTTIKTLLGFRPPDEGGAHIFGYDVASQSRVVRARVGFVSETNSLYDFLTIPQLCVFCRSVSSQWDQQVVNRHLGLFGLPPRELAPVVRPFSFRRISFLKWRRWPIGLPLSVRASWCCAINSST